MNQVELAKFWEAKIKKTWVVTLTGLGKKPITDTKIVNATTREGAIRCAKFNSIDLGGKRCSATARYADPVSDLHCVKAN